MMDEMPEHTRRVQDYMARRGWYLTGKIAPGDIFALDELISRGKESEIEDFMIKFVEDRCDEIRNRVCKEWSHRANILNEAFDAHYEGKYSLSIPVILAQADGISFETIGESLYSKKDGEPKTAKIYRERINRKKEVIDPDRDPVDVFFLRPLEHLCSIAVNTKDRDEKRKSDELYGPLNRHGVLHGEDLDYAKKPNSLRAILILDYLADLKKHYFKDIK